MLLIILLLSVLVTGTEAAITDLNCTHRVGADIKYAESAVNCRNKMSDANCQLIYGNAVKANTNDADRDAKCAGNPVNPQLLHTAISICPKQCGYCCLTPAFNCQNKPRPRYPCSSVTQDMCESNAWRDILAEDCPKTCGLCDSGSSFFCTRQFLRASNMDFFFTISDNDFSFLVPASMRHRVATWTTLLSARVKTCNHSYRNTARRHADSATLHLQLHLHPQEHQVSDVGRIQIV
nr:Metridin ShK toxin domain containing protein [Haemonchus contortus]